MVESKKNPKKDLNKTTGLFLNIGLVISLLLVIWAFEFKVNDEGSLVNLNVNVEQFEDLMDIPQTEQKPPPPPKKVQPEIIEVPDEEEIEEQIEIDLDIEMTEETVIEEVVFEEAPPEEEADYIHVIVEEQPSPVGGMKAFYEYVGDNLNYPAQARRMGISGRAFVQFVVEIDGTITDVVCAKSPGAGIAEEAERVIKSAPKWNAGKQRGRPVRVRIVQPLIFSLQ